MRKICFILVGLLLVSLTASCGSGKLIAEKNQIVFEGRYSSDDESVLTVTKREATYLVTIDIIRLTWIDDGIGIVSDSANRLEFCATDASGDPICGTLHWKSPDEVILEFTDSTWEYLPNGTKLEFSRTQSVIGLP